MHPKDDHIAHMHVFSDQLTFSAVDKVPAVQQTFPAVRIVQLSVCVFHILYEN